MWNFGTVFAICVLICNLYFIWLCGVYIYKNAVNLFISYLVFPLIYFVFLFAVKHLCGNHSLDLLLCTTPAIVRHVRG